MNQKDLELVKLKLPLSKSVEKLNGGIVPEDQFGIIPDFESKTSKRLRQSAKPLLNKLETEWFNILSVQHPNFPQPRAQAKRYRLCNGVVYTPDVTASLWPQENGPAMETAWEVKGPRSWDDAIVKLKMAASVWPEVRWILVWKENGKWLSQIVLP